MAAVGRRKVRGRRKISTFGCNRLSRNTLVVQTLLLPLSSLLSLSLSLSHFLFLSLSLLRSLCLSHSTYVNHSCPISLSHVLPLSNYLPFSYSLSLSLPLNLSLPSLSLFPPLSHGKGRLRGSLFAGRRFFLRSVSFETKRNQTEKKIRRKSSTLEPKTENRNGARDKMTSDIFPTRFFFFSLPLHQPWTKKSWRAVFF